MDTGGAPLKPWEVARIGQSQNTVVETAASKQEEKDSSNKGVLQTAQTSQPTPSYTPSYTPYAGLNTPYTSSYQTQGSYGGSYYGYPSSYGTGMYGTYGSGYGGMYSYGRPAWTQPPPHLPGGMPQPGDAPKPAMWQRFLDGLQKVVHCVGRVTFLANENTQAFHFFISALLAFLDKAGSFYGEIARFVMKLLGFGRRSKNNLRSGQAVRSSDGRNTATEIFKTIWKTGGEGYNKS